jgi:four helix bundle protein
MGKSYRDLFIWYESVDVAAAIVAMTDEFPNPKRYALIDQMQRAAISVPSNIAEGKGRLTDKELRHFLGTARGSLFELHTQLEIARKLNLLKPGTYEHLLVRMRKIGSGINNLLKRLNRSIAKQLNSSKQPSS